MPIEEAIASIMEDRRADYCWPTKEASRVLGIHPNKVSTWWYANRRKLIALAEAMPNETAAELMRVMAQAQSARHPPPPPPAPARAKVRPSL
jgi:hypothetical protein